MITGIDYDDHKIATARMAAHGLEHIRFIADDICTCQLPPADCYILSDVLHYLPEGLQVSLLERCMDALPDEGMLILRDADADLKRRTRFTKFTEFQSTRIFRFNKTRYPLTYLPASSIEKLAEQKGFQWKREDKAKLTSNVTYIIRRKWNHGDWGTQQGGYHGKRHWGPDVRSALLSLNGFRTIILEKHYQIGGNLQTFRRKGVQFNSAMHFVGAMEKGQILHQVFKYLGILENTGLEPLDPGSL